jgi:hypothetical protein
MDSTPHVYNGGFKGEKRIARTTPQKALEAQYLTGLCAFCAFVLFVAKL